MGECCRDLFVPCAVVLVVAGVGCVGDPPPLPAEDLGTTSSVVSEDTMSESTSEGGSNTISATEPTSTVELTSEPQAECGNGMVEDGEECDGIDWQGATCESLGFVGGGLECGDACAFDTTGCHLCGNQIVGPGEECDGVDLDKMTCESLGFSGTGLVCANCQHDASACGPMPGMVDVPGGEFTMGSNEEPDEQPIRQVQVDRFWIDQTEVTVADYADCLNDGACSEPNTGGSCNWTVAGRANHPVNCVDWFQAEEYCAWAGGGTKRLPTEAE